jgi:hypothetical protein
MPENLMFLDRLVLSSYLYELAEKVQQKVNNRSINYFYDDYVDQSRLSFYVQSYINNSGLCIMISIMETKVEMLNKALQSAKING